MLDALPRRRASDVPSVTRRQMREVDRLMIEQYKIDLLQMMENAGLQLAQAARMHLQSPLSQRRVVVLTGKGNNGGGGLVAARRLSAWGARVDVRTSGPPEELSDVPARQRETLGKMGIEVRQFDGTLPEHDLLIDAVIGYSLQGAPRGEAAPMIEAANASRAPTISLDVPSGVDVDTGEASGVAVQARATVTLALPKTGLLQSEEPSRTGQLYLADISVPPALYKTLGITMPALFDEGPLVTLLTNETP